jgi:hypothetical protein
VLRFCSFNRNTQKGQKVELKKEKENPSFVFIPVLWRKKEMDQKKNILSEKKKKKKKKKNILSDRKISTFCRLFFKMNPRAMTVDFLVFV